MKLMGIKLYLPVMLIMVMVGCQSKTNNENSTVLEKKQSPGLYEDLEGNTIKLSDYKGKKILLNFWATYCLPCLKEMPSMLHSQEILEKENYVFLLASNEETEKVKKFIDKKKYDFKFIKYKGTLAQQKIYALPTTFIYNEEGEKVETITGAVEWDSEEMIEKLKNLK